MTDHERYMFDLQGYLVIPDALSAEHLRELNTLMDDALPIPYFYWLLICFLLSIGYLFFAFR